MKKELIVRLNLMINFTGRKPYLVPDVLVLGNREGFLWLAEYFRARAQKEIPPEWEEPLRDPDDHWHLKTSEAPFNSGLSDELEFRVGLLTPKNRRAVRTKYNLLVSTAGKRNVIDQYERRIREGRKSAARWLESWRRFQQRANRPR